MRKVLFVGIATAALAAAMPAAASVSVTGVPNSTVTSGTVIESFANGGGNGTTFGTPVNTTGTVKTYNQNTGGVAVIGTGQNVGEFLGIAGNSSYTINVPAGTTIFSFLVGTLDYYNTVVLNTTTGSHTYTGTQLQTILGGIDHGSLTFNFSGGESLLNAVFSSTQVAFEIDQISAAAPEPATWGMMILGFGFAGASLRRRKRKLAIA